MIHGVMSAIVAYYAFFRSPLISWLWLIALEQFWGRDIVSEKVNQSKFRLP